MMAARIDYCARCGQRSQAGDYTTETIRIESITDTGMLTSPPMRVHLECPPASGCEKCDGGPQWGHAWDCPTLP